MKKRVVVVFVLLMLLVFLGILFISQVKTDNNEDVKDNLGTTVQEKEDEKEDE